MEMRRLVEGVALRALVTKALEVTARPVRGILFDKTSAAKWKVPWHQDVTIAVRHRVDVSGFGPLSMKEGILHVQPPASVLEKMISIRVHLDDCPEENGGLRVVPGSHLHGKLSAIDTESWVAGTPAVACPVGQGGVLIMRPLLLHASSAASLPAHRRVLHFDFAVCDLPDGMGWAADQA